MKEIIKRFVVRSSAAGKAGAFCCKLALLAAGMLLAQAAGAQTNFANPLLIEGSYGSVTVSNSGVMADIGAPSIAGRAPFHTVWFKWSCENSGEVVFDTVGSLTEATNRTELDTVLGAFKGDNLASLQMLAANDEMVSVTSLSSDYQTRYSFGDTNFPFSTNRPANSPEFLSTYSFSASGPSQVRFNAEANTIYYIAVDSYSLGTISLSWALHPSGVFRFASENRDRLGAKYEDRRTTMLLYQGAATESRAIRVPGGEPIQFSYLNDSAVGGGVMVTVTRMGGYSGRVQVQYTTAIIDTNSDPQGVLLNTNGFLVNGDLPADATKDFTPVSGTLIFDDYEMSKSFLVPIKDSSSDLTPRPNRDFLVLLTNSMVDPSEPAGLPAPRLDVNYSKALVRILDVHVNPTGYSLSEVTNIDKITGETNIQTVFSTVPTNPVFNFQKLHYKVYRAGAGKTFQIYVNRTGTNRVTGATISYKVNSDFPFTRFGSQANEGNTFPLQPGSDYATPDPANIVSTRGKIPDFNFDGGYTGTLNWGADDMEPKAINFTINDNGLQQFNEDFKISLYDVDKYGNPFQVGMVSDCYVTILNAREFVNGNSNTNQLFPPAGSVDELFNPDDARKYSLTGTETAPGTEGLVYGLAQQADGKTVVVGDFYGYADRFNGHSALNILRVNKDGTYDSSFKVGAGTENYISCVTFDAQGMIFIGGNFISYNNNNAFRIAKLDGTGKLNASFANNLGYGFDGPVSCMVFQPDGKLLVGGDFNTFNVATRNYLARLNADGTLDTTFNPGNNLSGPVLSMALQANGQIVIGGSFTNLSGVVGRSFIGRINADGSVDNSFDPAGGADGDVKAVAIQPDGNIVIGGNFTTVNGKTLPRLARLTFSGSVDASFQCPYGADGLVNCLTIETNALVSTTNYTTVVQTNFTIYVGGQFEKINGTHRLGIARLNADGTLDTSFMDTAYNQFAGLTRQRYGDQVGSVNAMALVPGGKVLIGGSFNQIGGGEFNENVRADSFVDAYKNNPFVRTAVRNRSNFARLIGGVTPGPGNVGIFNSDEGGSAVAYKSKQNKGVELSRTNGFLGYASVNFSVVPGLAQNGVDYIYNGDYNGTTPIFISDWAATRMHSDGLFGLSSVPVNEWGDTRNDNTAARINLTITGNTNTPGNLNAQLLLSNPLGDGQFLLGGENIPLGVALGVASVPLSIIDDRKISGTFGFSSADYFSAGPLAEISVTRSNGTYGDVKVIYGTTSIGSTAVAGADYTPIAPNDAKSLLFPQNQMFNSFKVAVLSSNYNSSVEKVVKLYLPKIAQPADGIAFAGITNATLHIINPNFAGYLTLGATNYGANLSAGAVTFTVSRTVGNNGTMTVQYRTVDGSAQNGVDFVGVTNSLTWNGGDATTRTITIPLLNNNQPGTNRQFNIQLFNPANNGVSSSALFAATSITNAAVTIVNDNSFGTFQFSTANYIVNESGGYATVTVVRTGSTNGTVQLQCATMDNSALAGTNYVPTNVTLNFQPGQLAASFGVPIISDGTANPGSASFFFYVGITNLSAGGLLGAPTLAAVHIVDDAIVSPAGSNDKSFGVGSGMNGDVLALAIQSNGKILAGGSFTAVDGTPESYIARLNGNGTLDSTGFLFGLAGANSPVYALAMQTDDRILVGGSFTTFNNDVQNRITRLLFDGSKDSSFNAGAGANATVYSLGEAFIGGQRKIYVGGAFTTLAGANRPRIARLNDNGTIDTVFNVGVGPNGPVYALVAYPSNSVFAGKVLIGGAFTNINGYAASGIARLNVDGSVDTNFTAKVNVDGVVRAIALQNDGQILIGGDFTGINNQTIAYLARLGSDGALDNSFTATVNGVVNAIVVQADNRIVVGGQFSQANGVLRNNITRLLGSGLTDTGINFGSGANGSINALIVQPGDQNLLLGGSFTKFDEQSAAHIARVYGGVMVGTGSFEFTSGAYQVNENGALALISIRRTGATAGPNSDGSGNVSVNFATSPGEVNPAVAGVNYSPVNTTVLFSPGEVFKQIPVSVMQDSNVTDNLTVNLKLSNPVPATAPGKQESAVLTILNVDSLVRFQNAGNAVPKDTATGFGTLQVVRLGTEVGVSSVEYFTTTNGSAQVGVDYYPTNGTVVFNAGETNRAIYVPIINNPVFTGDRTITLSLSNVIGAVMAAPSNAVLTIQESVKTPGNLRFEATDYPASSGGEYAYLTVLRTNGTYGAASATYTTIAGTALPGVDYYSTVGTVTFNPGESTKQIAIQLFNNSIAKPAVNFSVILSDPTGEAGIGLVDPTNAVVTIVNTNNGYGFVSATNLVDESNGSVLVYVQRYGSSSATTSVNYGTTNGTALAGINYQGVSGALTFFPGEVQKAITVPIMRDPNANGDVTFNVGLTQPGNGAQLVAPAVTTVVLQDADAGFSFTNTTLTVTKSDGAAVITVICSNPRVEPVITSTNVVPLQVDYTTADGTAVAGVEYKKVTGTLVFTNGIGTNTFVVPIYGNGLVTGDRTFTVSLVNPTAPGQLKAPSTQTVVILDNNTAVSFSKANYTAFKNGVAAAIDVNRIGYTNSVASVNFVVTNGTAVNGVNFVSTNGTLTFTNGVTKQTFLVPLIAGNTVQPNLTVALRLLEPVDCRVLSPSSATLTLLENSGSYVAPAGAQMVTNYTSHLNDGIIYSNDTVQVLFGFRVAAGYEVTNLVAYLLATNGVAQSSQQQEYGTLKAYGHSVSMPFTFTAKGTNGLAIAPTFALYDTNKNLGTAKYLGTAVFGFTLGTWTQTFVNTNKIIINDNAAASPYPSVINVTGVGGALTKATVTLTNMTHGSVRDVSALVVSPANKSTLIMSWAGGVYSVKAVTLTFDDAAASGFNPPITSGTNKPTANLIPISFP